MTPLEAAALAAELLAHMDVLSSLDLHPNRSATEIEMHRQEAHACTERLSAYLLLSDTFAGL